MSKVTQHQQLTETLGLTECSDGWWLYDETRSMNLSIKAKTPTDAFVEALTFYQERLKETENRLAEIEGKVNAFVNQFVTEEPWYNED